MASLRYSVESALSTYLTSESVGATVFTGMDYDDKTAPCVIVAVTSAEEDPPFSGGYRVSVTISIRDSASSNSDMDDIADAVRNSIWKSDLTTSLNAQAVTGLTVSGVSAPHRIEYTQEGDCWVETQYIEIYCSAT